MIRIFWASFALFRDAALCGPAKHRRAEVRRQGVWDEDSEKGWVPAMAKFPVLNQNGDFKALYHRGQSKAHPALVTYALRQTARRHPRRGPGMKQKPFFRIPGPTRVGITTGKKAGGAVERSRCRRVIREAWRALLPAVPPGWDIVFVARTGTAEIQSGALRRVMEKQLVALGVLARGKEKP